MVGFQGGGIIICIYNKYIYTYIINIYLFITICFTLFVLISNATKIPSSEASWLCLLATSMELMETRLMFVLPAVQMLPGQLGPWCQNLVPL